MPESGRDAARRPPPTVTEAIEQLVILLGSAAAVTGLALGGRLPVLCGSLAGLVSQAAWIRSSLRHRQWGIFVVSLYFVAVYLYALLEVVDP